jgi:hypothetical protein
MDTSEQTILDETPKREARRRDRSKRNDESSKRR